MDWIKKQADQVRAKEAQREAERLRNEVYAKDARDNFHVAWPVLCAEIQRQVGRFNEEFRETPGREIGRVEVNTQAHRFVIERSDMPAVMLQASWLQDDGYITMTVRQRRRQCDDWSERGTTSLHFCLGEGGHPLFVWEVNQLSAEEAAKRFIEPFFEYLA